MWVRNKTNSLISLMIVFGGQSQALETGMKDAIQEVIIALIFLSLPLCCCTMKRQQLKY